MNSMKKAYTIDQQIARLKSNGMTFDDEEKAKEILLDVGYYRLGFYSFPYEIKFPCLEHRDHQLKPGTTFKSVYDLYEFDTRLRRLLLNALDRIEVNIRTKLIYNISLKYIDDPCWFVNRKYVTSKFVNDFEEQVYAVMRKNPIIQRHHANHPGIYAPAWKTIEFMTIGNIITLYDSLKGQKLDSVFKRRKEYIRASSGKVKLEFKPQLDKSFSRGFTNFFLFDRNKDIFSFDTPKSLGEEMGTVKEIRGNYLTVAGIKSFNNGDGVCFLDETGKLQGFRINRVENNKLFPQEMPRIKPRTILYRNFDQEFERLMSRKSAERKIAVILKLAENNRGFTLSLTDEDDHSASVVLEREKERARTPQEDNLRTQLGKLGNTPFEASDIVIDWSDNWFIPASMLAELRRKGIEKLLEVRRINYRQEIYKLPRTHHAFPVNELTYLGNVMNADAVSFYRNHGVQRIAPAYEKAPAEEAVLMFCKHCLRYSMGWCPSWHKVRSPYREPYYLVSSDNRRFRLEFDCKNCQMKVYAEK